MRIPAFGARSRLRKPERFSGKRSRFKRTSRKLLRRRYEAYRCRIVYGTQRDGAGTASYRSGRLVSRPRLVGRRDYDLKDRGTSMHRRTARDGVCRRRGTARNLAGASAVCPDARVSPDPSGWRRRTICTVLSVSFPRSSFRTGLPAPAGRLPTGRIVRCRRRTTSGERIRAAAGLSRCRRNCAGSR